MKINKYLLALIKRDMKRSLLLTTVLAVMAVNVLAQCVEPLDAKAFEALLNVDNVKVDFSKLLACKQVFQASSNVFAYKSGFDERFAIVLSLQALPGSKDQFPMIRVQLIPNSRGEVSDEDLRRVLSLELDRLCREGVLVNMNESLKSKLVSCAGFGLAGWDRMLVWSNGGFTPFNESAFYVPPRGCIVPLISDYSSLPVWSANQIPFSAQFAVPIIILTIILLLVVAFKKKPLSRKKAI